MKYQLIIIGGGPAGYTAAEAAGKAGLSVLLIEKNSLGGVCLNEGCIPTKTLLYSAKTYVKMVKKFERGRQDAAGHDHPGAGISILEGGHLLRRVPSRPAASGGVHRQPI